MRSVETRFVGHGNIQIANNRRGWQLICCRCGATKTLHSHHGVSLSPHALARKFRQLGWHVGRNPGEDVCVGCVAGKKKAAATAAANANGHAPLVRTWLSVQDYFAQLHRVLQSAQKALRQQRATIAASYVDDALLRTDPTVTNALLAVVRPAEPPSAPAPAPAPEPAPAPVLPPPPPKAGQVRPAPRPQRDEDYDAWLDSIAAAVATTGQDATPP
jgi:hypothetical protein